MNEIGVQSTPAALGSTADPTGPTWRQVLHQLNNVFASIHSSLDLALVNEGRPEAASFLRQAQESARRGARVVNELRLRGKETEVWERQSEEPPAKPAGSGTGTSAQPESLEGSERILLVEDDESVRMLIRAVLTYRGYEVAEAVDGEEAVNQYRKDGPFELVIMDLHMPKVSGLQALELIQEQDPEVCAVALSGMLFDGEDPDGEATPQGFEAHLKKPFDNMELLTLVRQLLDRKKSQG
jgi:CheY-like chemotaxis protein